MCGGGGHPHQAHSSSHRDRKHSRARSTRAAAPLRAGHAPPSTKVTTWSPMGRLPTTYSCEYITPPFHQSHSQPATRESDTARAATHTSTRCPHHTRSHDVACALRGIVDKAACRTYMSHTTLALVVYEARRSERRHIKTWPSELLRAWLAPPEHSTVHCTPIMPCRAHTTQSAANAEPTCGSLVHSTSSHRGAPVARFT